MFRCKSVEGMTKAKPQYFDQTRMTTAKPYVLIKLIMSPKQNHGFGPDLY